MKLFRLAVLLALFTSPAMACQMPVLSDNGCGIVVWSKSGISAAELAARPPAEYMLCEKDSDCTLEKGICGQAMAVNTKGAKAYREAAVEASKALACNAIADPLSNFNVACNQGRCIRSPL